MRFIPIPQNYFVGGMFSDTQSRLTLLTPSFVEQHFTTDEQGYLAIKQEVKEPEALEPAENVPALEHQEGTLATASKPNILARKKPAKSSTEIIPKEFALLRVRPENLVVDDSNEDGIRQLIYHNEYGLETVEPYSIPGGILGFNRQMIVSIDPPNAHGQPGLLSAMFLDGHFGRYPGPTESIRYRGNDYDFQSPPPPRPSSLAPVATSVRDPRVQAHEKAVARFLGREVPEVVIIPNEHNVEFGAAELAAAGITKATDIVQIGSGPALVQPQVQVPEQTAQSEYYRDLGYPSGDEDEDDDDDNNSEEVNIVAVTVEPLNIASDRIPPPDPSYFTPPEPISTDSDDTHGMFSGIRRFFRHCLSYIRTKFWSLWPHSHDSATTSSMAAPASVPVSVPTPVAIVPPLAISAMPVAAVDSTSPFIPLRLTPREERASTTPDPAPVKRLHRYGGRKQERSMT